MSCRGMSFEEIIAELGMTREELGNEPRSGECKAAVYSEFDGAVTSLTSPHLGSPSRKGTEDQTRPDAFPP